MSAPTAEQSNQLPDYVELTKTGKKVSQIAWDPKHPDWPKKTRGFCGKCIHITVLPQDNEPMLVTCQLGDLPQINVLRGYDWIIPIEYKNHFIDSSVPSFEHIFVPDKPNPIVKKTRKNHYPASFGADATWEEYEAFLLKMKNEGVEA